MTAPANAALHGTGRALASLQGVRLTELDTATRQVAHDVAASHEAARAISPAAPSTPPLAPPTELPPAAVAPEVAPSHDREARPIEHAQHDAGAHGDRISAGPRPRVPLTGAAAPAHADAARRDGQDQLDARLAASHGRSAADHGVSRLHAAVHRAPLPAPVPIALPEVVVPAIPEAPWRALPPETRKRLDQAAAPELDRRIAQLTAGADADTQAAAGELAGVQARHQAQRAADNERAHAQMTALRTAGTAQVHALRGRWQAQGHAMRDTVTAQLHAQHAAMETDVQDLVRTGEARAHTILTGAETDANATRAAADTRVAAIRADAQARAQAARSRAPGTATARSIARRTDGSGGPAFDGGGGEQHVQQILVDAEAEIDREIARAKQDIDHLLATAGSLSQDEIEHRLLRINARITALKASLKQKVDQALGDKFPRLEATYQGQIDQLLGSVSTQLFRVADDLDKGHLQAARDTWAMASKAIDRRTARLHGTFKDVEALATFDSVDAALDKYGIDVNGWYANTKANNDVKEDILSQAIRVENAFRAADKQHLLDKAGYSAPGAAFKALMNEGNRIAINNKGGAGGAKTFGADRIDVYGLSPDKGDAMANARQFQFGHEFGHAFNGGMIYAQLDSGDSTLVPYQHKYTDRADRTKDILSGPGAFDSETITVREDGMTIPVAGKGVKRFVPTGDDLSGIAADPVKLAALKAKYASQGMQMGTQYPFAKDPKLQDLPYQEDMAIYQDATQNNGEWFADIFVNWANGTLADNPAGDEIDAWMTSHMQGWIAMGLDADKAKAGK